MHRKRKIETEKEKLDGNDLGMQGFSVQVQGDDN